eukprot:snap_masked-scaffold_21-processed-gene-1.18-mRNA-1 protein AED:0.28 eAED:0.33 QI:0/-1/0/1/-1/1/1/0/166
MKQNLYKLLGIPSTSSFKQIQNAYRNKIKRLHPDKWKHQSLTIEEQEFKEEAFLSVQEAFRILSNSKTRIKYDRTVNKGVETSQTFQKDGKIYAKDTNGNIIVVFDLNEYYENHEQFNSSSSSINNFEVFVKRKNEIEIERFKKLSPEEKFFHRRNKNIPRNPWKK